MFALGTFNWEETIKFDQSNMNLSMGVFRSVSQAENITRFMKILYLSKQLYCYRMLVQSFMYMKWVPLFLY